ncbi:glycosyltransferase [Xylanimonas ulmi]|uniref:Glycosyltransferase involved in cell wall biosynthesis n=1 Tax=Xylanimonas ulmi TaxID=228973 RepID=A0A4Q7M6D2_9MICO|nr:glycosyltransferase [Xylanibacterium ulmi]RZS62607.1 glycosyltransferase involved in cell wall biosynthesis [Xylanibacterium ulmi]
MSGADVVFTFSYETWDDAVRRGMMRPPDRLLGTLLGSDEVRHLLVVNPWRSLPTVAARRVLRRDAPFPAEARVRLHTPTRLRRADPTDVARLEAQYIAYDHSVRRAARAHADPAVLTTNPLVAGFAPLRWAGPVTYFARDDWLSSPARRPYWDAYREAYRRIADAGLAVAAVSAEILERIAPRGPARVVPNGVEPAEWLGPAPGAPAWLDALPHPRAVYVGTLDDRLDVEGVAALAAARPGLSVVLLGPCPNPTYVDALRGVANVHLHDGVGRAELVAALRSCDLALLAHRRTPLTAAMSPLKVYEYLAAGLPVLATDLPPVRGVHPRVTLLDDVRSFADAVDDALDAGPLGEPERTAFVEANSWSRRHRTVLELTLRDALVSGA